MWAMSITGHPISHWLLASLSWVRGIIGTWGGNSVKRIASAVAAAARVTESCSSVRGHQVELAEAREECRVQTERVTLMGCEQASYRDRIETLQAAVSLLQLELSAVERPRVAAPNAPNAPTTGAQVSGAAGS